ncbi:MATE family efflux transporter [Paenibacillus selenitireducens]|uniref:MATE family efflux transporter n=1 Tax=Paenibacillus selenitireducens TaxID=1324314 RepID=A0A1T2XM47_9BACL|nr:MATE family efflux transporter [Paenibacillus selenitireducens]OPA80892.1 MATE family efflux transporter [Paenibacillus selenitireducens]
MNKQQDKPLTLFGLTWPIFLEQFLQTIILNIDTLMLSKYSDRAVAAVGVSSQILTVAYLMFGFVTVGLSVFISQLLGAGKEQEASKVGSISMGLNLIFGVAVSLILVVFAKPLLVMMKLPPELMEEGYTFLFTMGWFSFIVAIMNTANAILRMHGFVRQMLLLSFAVIVLNVIGNYLFIYGPLGIPVLGVKGVALATGMSRIIGLAIVLYMLMKYMRHPLSYKQMFRFPIDYVKEIMKIGIPSAGENISYMASQVFITYFVAILGTAALTTKIYTQNITTFVFLFSVSIGQATSMIIGRLIGAAKYDDAYRQCYRSLKIGLLITFGIGCLLNVFSRPLISLFTSDEEVIHLGQMLMLLSLVLEAARACNVIVIAALNAAGEVKYPVFMGLISMWGVSIPLAYLFGIVFHLGIPGIWIAFIVDEWLRGALMLLRWRTRKWQQIRFNLISRAKEM